MISLHKYAPPQFEVVERKGIGHPDTLADGISEAISRSLSGYYLEEFGQILHHNVDKVLIIAGQSQPRFGGGSISKPPSVVVGGRATKTHARPLDEIIEEATATLFRNTVKNLETFLVEPRVEEGAPELRSLIGKGANDTSIGVGYAPLSSTERLVLELEEEVRGIRGVGEDTKIMAVRIDDRLNLVVAAAMVDRFIGSREEYEDARAQVYEVVKRRAGQGSEVGVNCADSGDNIYLTVTGTSIEMGDDGATGRGNRGNGLITPMRPMTMEAIAGKNPVSHVGKIYNVLAQRCAREIAELEGAREAYVTLVSRIGSPISQPLLRAVRISGDMQLTAAREAEINHILDYWLERSGDLVEEFVKGRLMLY
ncbi:MAG: methionine adenosyltransferase [Methanothrix sp.]|jgi:S-adenosylmethionine synthetase|uniref:methionine adenosyltransferase n=1 Tax=Methanothrix sp. TaxID=90426 RepID=UPI0025D95963|nr:methionine adenosyltransferase [Methanothrix sp.]MBK7386794.1 methionine adenosyltransferase [Methanothrix sp.]HPW73306.1 methionine adenosyltransferase [Methanothrix sp.]